MFHSGKDTKAKEEKEKAEAKLNQRKPKQGGKARRMKQQWASAGESPSGSSAAASGTNDGS